jgi:PIN domain nuclease of toxin-antitoxin system
MDDDSLTTSARRLIDDPRNTVFVSVVSLWEISIKSALRRPRSGAMPISSASAHQDFEEAGFDILPVSARHAIAVQDLPRIHGDPFDRLLIAQAFEEPLRLVTHDVTVANYGDTIIRF